MGKTLNQWGEGIPFSDIVRYSTGKNDDAVLKLVIWLKSPCSEDFTVAVIFLSFIIVAKVSTAVEPHDVSISSRNSSSMGVFLR